MRLVVSVFVKEVAIGERALYASATPFRKLLLLQSVVEET